MKWHKRRLQEVNYNYWSISKRLSKKFYTCSWCGDELPEEELESPSLDYDNDIMCDECYQNEYEFTCAICEAYTDKESSDDIDRLIIVINSEEAGVEKGTYKIIRHPYYTSNMIDTWFNKEAIEKISDNTFEADSAYAACHICSGCTDEILNSLIMEKAWITT